MKKLLTITALILLFWPAILKADEGMWLPALLEKVNLNQMKAEGSRLSAEDIYSVNHSSLKDAVVALDHGSCTAELVSEDGLLLTNHHCGFDEIQEHSSTEHDYLRDGFWARSKDEELPNPGKSASFLIRCEDVSAKILAALSDTLTEEQREQKIREISAKIEKDAMSDDPYEARVQSLYNGNQFFLFIYETFRDIRLVAAPPQSMGKFGGDTDNWMWPRQTDDFSMFRIYCGKDGKPASYSKDNVPFKPKYHFTISLDGYKKNDFAMVMGYPGSTNRYKTSYGIGYTMDVTNPIRIKVREAKQNIMKDFMKTSQKDKLMYAAKYARSSNYYKYSVGQNEGLQHLEVIAQKKELENQFRKWVNADPQRQAKYGKALELIADAYKDVDDEVALEYMMEAMVRGPEIFYFAYRMRPLLDALNSEKKAKHENLNGEHIDDRLDEFYKDFDATTDQKIAAALFKIYEQNVKPLYFPPFIKTVQTKFKNNFDEYTRDLYDRSIFSSKEKLSKFLQNPKAKTLEKDPIFQASLDIFRMMRVIGNETEKTTDELSKGNRLFLEGLMEMEKNKTFYPDANSTMRLTYGTVGDYDPRDGVHYNYFTTLKGYIEKEIPGDDEFDVPAKLKEMYYANDYGRYADNDGTLHTCFITNDDITGGNSGSPVINSNGQLIGIAFDGNWEAMTGDLAYEKNVQKTICVDIRFVLWTIDKFAGAKNLIDEMTIEK
jgi:hypothetical protein